MKHWMDKIFNLHFYAQNKFFQPAEELKQKIYASVELSRYVLLVVPM